MMADLTCDVRHPRTDEMCSKFPGHTADIDPSVQQHEAVSGVKWPTLHELNPSEGFNAPQAYRN